MQSLAASVLDYWPAILILIGVSHVAVAINADTAFGRIVAIICLLFWRSLGVVYFLYHPPLIWLWRLLPIGFGLSGFASECEKEEGWFLFLTFVWGAIFFGGVSALFFLYEPTEVWHWVSEQEVVKWLFAGPWYIVLGKLTGFVGSIAAVIKYLTWIFSQMED
jgi:hypothetical protein